MVKGIHVAESDKTKKPRVRKTETIRERNEKVASKLEAKANKQPKGRIRKFFKLIARPFRAPARIISAPFRTRPMRFIGRVLGRILWPKYFRNSWKEVRQVSWPDRRTTWKLTFAVIIFAILFGLAAAGTDWILDKVIKRIVFKA